MDIVVALCLCVLAAIGTCEAYGQCKVPHGGAGACVDVAACRPLLQLYTKKRKTEEEHLFLRQSYCGNQATAKIRVCCPDSSLWDNFRYRPVAYPNSLPLWDSVPEPVAETAQSTKQPPLLAPVPSPLPLDTDVGEVFAKISLDKQDLVSGDAEQAPVCGRDVSSGNKITGGEPAAIDQYPWLVLLEYSGGLLGCGGSLVTARFVLTAAHCVESVNGVPVVARLGEYNTTSFPTDEVEVDGGGVESITVTMVPVERAIKHPQFTRLSDTLAHDIGLVKLSRSAVFSDFIKIICLPRRDYVLEFTERTNFTVAGWGDENVKTKYHDVKKHVTVPYVPADRCNVISSDKQVTDRQICAGGRDGQDSCKGDSGGPLMFEAGNAYVAVGVVSYGTTPCGIKTIPGVYTHVYKYLDWIDGVIGNRL